MTCRLCGAKLNVMERWRYGDFCSQNHKDDFAQEVQRLGEERLMSLRRPGSSSLSTNTLFVDSDTVPDTAEPVEAIAVSHEAAVTQVVVLAEPKAGPETPAPAEPDPDIQEFLSQSVLAPQPPRRPAPPAEPPAQKPTRKDWKYLAKVADFDLLPVGLNSGLSRLFRMMELENATAGEEFVVAPTRQVFVPEPFQPEDRRSRAQLPNADLRPRESYHEQSWASAPPPVTIPRHTWVDDAGRRWISSEVTAAPGDYPGIGEVLEDYPISAPWTDWPEWMLKGESSWAPTNSPRRSAPPPAAAPRPAAAPPPAMTGGAPPTFAGGRPAALVSGPPPALASGPPPSFSSGPPPAAPSAPNPPVPPAAAQKGLQLDPVAPAPPASRRSGPAAQDGQTRPSTYGARSAEPASSGAATPSGAASASGPRSPVQRGSKSRWQPIVPPIFHALIDIAHDMQAIPAEPVNHALPCRPIRAARSVRPLRPAANFPIETRLELRETSQSGLAPNDPFAPGAAAIWAVDDTVAWPHPLLALPRLRLRAGKPGLPPLPRHVHLRLPLLDRWSVQASEPAMFLGASNRW